jgi:excisionase family DNA binding protein
MRTLTHNSGESAESSSAQESLKILLKALMEGALGLVGRVGDKPARGTRKGKTSSQAHIANVTTLLSQEVVDAIADRVAKTLADLGNHQVAVTRAMLTATLAMLDAKALQGKAVSVTSANSAEDDTELTTEEAAQLLFVSRPYMVKLLDTHVIPLAHRTVGGQRRVRKVDVLRYKALLRSRQEIAMGKLAKANDTLSLYEGQPAITRTRKR